MDFFKLLPIRTWASVGVALCIAGLATWGFMAIRGSGVAVCEREHAELNALHVELAAAQAYQISLQDAEVISWADNARTKTVFKTLWRDHETVAYADCSLSPAGRVLFNKAIRAATDISDSSFEGESGSATNPPGNGDTEGNRGGQHQERGSDSSDRGGSGGSAENVGSAWVVGGAY